MKESYSDVLQRAVRSMDELTSLHECAVSLRPQGDTLEAVQLSAASATPFMYALQGCEVCGGDKKEGTRFWDGYDAPILAICVDCLATGLEIALGVKMEGLMAQWRQAKALKAARLAAKFSKQGASQKSRKVKNASEC